MATCARATAKLSFPSGSRHGITNIRISEEKSSGLACFLEEDINKWLYQSSSICFTSKLYILSDFIHAVYLDNSKASNEDHLQFEC